MAWVKIDDQLYTHEKRWELDLDGIGLFVLMLCYANDKLTDGFVPRRFVESQVPRPDRRGVVKALLATGMLTEAEDGYLIRDYLDFQPSRAQVMSRRAERSESGRRGAKARWADGSSHSSSHGSGAGSLHAPYPDNPSGREGSSTRAHQAEVATPTENGGTVVALPKRGAAA